MSGTGAVAERMEPRLKQHYLREVVPQLKEKFGYKNDLAVPKLEKIVVGVGLSEARENVKVVDRPPKRSRPSRARSPS